MKYLILIIAFAFLGVRVGAQRVVTTAVPFLRISPDARASGMGDVGVATMPDTYAGFWNMGKVVFNTRPGTLGMTYSPWLRDISGDMYIASLSGYHTLDSAGTQAITASLRYFNLGELQYTDAFGYHQQAMHPREWAFDAGYSRKVSERAGVGIAFRYIHSSLSNKGVSGNDYTTGSAVAVDLGWWRGRMENGELRMENSGWAYGIVLSNLGSKMAYAKNTDEKNFIPANLGLGTAYTWILNKQNKVSAAVDLNKLLVPGVPANADSAGMMAYRNRPVVGSWFHSFDDGGLKTLQLSAGAEYWYNGQFALRAGYCYEDRNQGNRRYFTVGAGIKYNIFNLNFSYLAPSGSGMDRNPLSNTMRFGLVLDER